MNKYQEYQEALIDIKCDSYNFIENNYEDAFKMVYNKQFKLLQDLVDKETPKKFKIKTDKDGRVIWVCPKCGEILMKFWSDVETIRPFNYCDECGQKLDWEVEDEE